MAQRGNAEVAQKEYMERLSQVWAKHNSHPLKSLASLMVQAPVFICFFSALRHMAAAQARPCKLLPMLQTVRCLCHCVSLLQ